jgi:hypothetical protein
MVVNSEGKFFRAKGRNGYGESWVDDPKKARVYNKIGPAKAAATFFGRSNKYPVPNLIEFSPGEIVIINQTQRITKLKQKEAVLEAKRAEQRKAERVHQAKNELYKAQQLVDKLTAQLKATNGNHQQSN